MPYLNEESEFCQFHNLEFDEGQIKAVFSMYDEEYLLERMSRYQASLRTGIIEAGSNRHYVALYAGELSDVCDHFRVPVERLCERTKDLDRMEIGCDVTIQAMRAYESCLSLVNQGVVVSKIPLYQLSDDPNDFEGGGEGTYIPAGESEYVNLRLAYNKPDEYDI